jgi:hypothetical protein
VRGDESKDGTDGGSEMSRRNANQAAMKRYVAEHPVCELCGSKKGIECHHVLPMCMEGYGVDFDIEDNYITVCRKCHALLTPRPLLAKYGMERSRWDGDLFKNIRYQFYKKMGEFLDETGGFADATDVMDVFDDTISGFEGSVA